MLLLLTVSTYNISQGSNSSSASAGNNASFSAPASAAFTAAAAGSAAAQGSCSNKNDKELKDDKLDRKHKHGDIKRLFPGKRSHSQRESSSDSSSDSECDCASSAHSKQMAQDAQETTLQNHHQKRWNIVINSSCNHPALSTGSTIAIATCCTSAPRGAVITSNNGNSNVRITNGIKTTIVDATASSGTTYLSTIPQSSTVNHEGSTLTFSCEIM